MKRYAAWAFGAGLMVVGLSTPTSAQVRVDIGVVAPHIGARVVLGAPRVVHVPVQRRVPVYASRDYRRDNGHWNKRDREYFKDVRRARRDYERDLREAQREYERELREAGRGRGRR